MRKPRSFFLLVYDGCIFLLPTVTVPPQEFDALQRFQAYLCLTQPLQRPCLKSDSAGEFLPSSQFTQSIA
jgi:hypothetical protein